MTPVISPWVFYLMYVCDNIAYVVSALAIIAIIIAALSALLAIGFWASDDAGAAKRAVEALTKRVIPICAALWIAASLLPDKATLTQMTVAQNVTYDRVEDAAAVVQTVYEDIMNLFEEDTDED